MQRGRRLRAEIDLTSSIPPCLTTYLSSPKTGPIGHWVKYTMLLKPAHEIEEAGRLSELKETIKMKLVFRHMGKRKLATGYKEGRVAAKSGRLYFDEAFLPVGLK